MHPAAQGTITDKPTVGLDAMWMRVWGSLTLKLTGPALAARLREGADCGITALCGVRTEGRVRVQRKVRPAD